MKHLINKELTLFASPLTYFFLAFSLMTLLPGYPILMGAFFVCFGIFQSFQNGRETNDILYTVLLPVRKADAVKAKFLFICLIQLLAFMIMFLLTLFRMTILKDAEPYVHNALMNANPLFLCFVLLIFSAFNQLFVRGFFRTAYKIGRPFICFLIASILLIGIGETLHHLPGFPFLNRTGLAENGMLWPYLVCSAALYALLTYHAYRSSVHRFERVDL